MTEQSCTIEGCARPAKSRTWCTTHYERWRRTGTTDDPPTLTLWERHRRADHPAHHHGVAHWAFRVRMVVVLSAEITVKRDAADRKQGMTLDDLCVTPHDSDRQALPTLRLCSSCRAHLQRLIAEMPALYADLERALAVTGSGGQRVSGSASEPLPINPAVADHRDQIQHDLVWWCVYVAQQRGIALPAASAPATTAAWLTVHAEWLSADQVGAQECLPVMRQLAGRARGLLYPSGSKRIKVGPCPTTVEQERCGGTLYATVRAEDDQRPSVIYCDTCDFEKGAEEWMRFGREYLRERMAG